MSEAGRFVVHYLVNSVWQTPLLLLAAWLVSRILRKLGPAAQHRVWTAVLMVAAIAPCGAFKRSEVSVHLLVDWGSANFLTDPRNVPGAAGLAPGTLRLVPALYFAILCAYLLYLVFAGLRLGWGLSKTRRLVLHSTAIGLPAEVAEIWQRCQSAFAIPTTTLASSPDLTGPVTIGIRNAVLLMPPGFISESTQEDLAAALGHECAHLERRDFFLNLLYQLISLTISYHPATWLIKSRIAETRELVCDRMAAERIAGPLPYARSLLRLAASMHAGGMTNSHHAIGMFDANTLEDRIMSLITSQPSVSRARKMILLTSGISLLSLSGITAVALTANVEELANGGQQQATVDGASQSVAAPIQNPPQNSSGSRSENAAALPPQTYHVGGPVSPPKLTYAPDPEFPRGQKKGGVVVIACTVDAEGKPRQVRVVRSLSHPFDKNAVRAVEQYRFTPAILKGDPAPKPVAVAVNIEVNFRRY
jgi:TonB family protein